MPQDRPGLRPGAPTRAEREDALRAELQRIVSVLRDLGALKVILFGSAARDEIRASSDLDLIVVIETDEPFLDRFLSLRQAIKPQVTCDILVYTPEEFQQMPSQSLVVRQALREGKVLYEAAAQR